MRWQGPAGTAFSGHLTTRVQAKRLTGQALQQKSQATSNYADQLAEAQAQWNSGKGLLNGLPGQLRGQVLGGDGLSVAGLGITDPLSAAGLLAQAGEALAQMVAAQVKAQAAATQFVESLSGLQSLLDEVQSLLSGNQSQAEGAPVAPAGLPPAMPALLVGLSAGGLGSMVMPGIDDPPILGDPIPEPLPPILGDPIPEPLPPTLGDPIPEPPPPTLGDPIPEPLPQIQKSTQGDGQGEGQDGSEQGGAPPEEGSQQGQKLPDDRIQAAPDTRGRPPTGDDGYPVELHHRDQQPDSPLDEITRTDHRLGDNYGGNHPNTGQSPTQIDRSALCE